MAISRGVISKSGPFHAPPWIPNQTVCDEAVMKDVMILEPLSILGLEVERSGGGQ